MRAQTASSLSAPHPSSSRCWRRRATRTLHKGSRCTPANAAHSPPRRSPAPARARHAAPDGQAHSQLTDQPPSLPTRPRFFGTRKKIARKNCAGEAPVPEHAFIRHCPSGPGRIDAKSLMSLDLPSVHGSSSARYPATQIGMLILELWQARAKSLISLMWTVKEMTILCTVARRQRPRRPAFPSSSRRRRPPAAALHA